MYQVTWSEAPETIPDKVKMIEKWTDVLVWINANDRACHYSVGVVVESTIQDHVGFEDQTNKEKSYLMDALSQAVPDMDEPGEIAATLMNFAHAYWTHDQMVHGFVMLSRLAESITQRTPDKNKLH